MGLIAFLVLGGCCLSSLLLAVGIGILVGALRALRHRKVNERPAQAGEDERVVEGEFREIGPEEG
jgi:hypothetical protein